MCVRGGMVEKVQEGFSKILDGASGGVVLAAVISACIIGFYMAQLGSLSEEVVELKAEVAKQRNTDQQRALDLQLLRSNLDNFSSSVKQDLAEIKAILVERGRADSARVQ